MDRHPRYLVELAPDAGGCSDLQQASSRARRASAELQAEGSPVRLLRSVYVPEDDTCYLLFEAGESWIVDEVGQRAAVDFRRVAEPL